MRSELSIPERAGGRQDVVGVSATGVTVMPLCFWSMARRFGAMVPVFHYFEKKLHA